MRVWHDPRMPLRPPGRREPAIETHARARLPGGELAYTLRRSARARHLRVTVDPGRGIVLTDDHNPIEFYDAANRERYRRALALSMRNR